MEKTYKLEWYGNTYDIALRKTTYTSNDTLAIAMVSIDKDGCEEDFGMLTTNIGESNILADETSAFVDTNNLTKKIISWLTNNKIAKKTPFTGFSGYCSYPLMAFNQKVLNEMVEYA